MDNNSKADLPVRAFRHATTVQQIDRDSIDGDDLVHQIQSIQSMSEQSQSTTWRRAILLWLRIYQWEKVEGSKAKRLDLRIPIPFPILGVFLRRHLTWEQSLHVLRALRRAPDADRIEPYLDGCMALEFLRIEEEKNEKKELLVIGLD